VFCLVWFWSWFLLQRFGGGRAFLSNVELRAAKKYETVAVNGNATKQHKAASSSAPVVDGDALARHGRLHGQHGVGRDLMP
jgi:hypothetical protein